MPLNNLMRAAILVTMGVCVIAPFMLLLEWAFAASWIYPNLFPDFSGDKFADYIDSGRIKSPLVNSLTLSALVTLVSMAIGLLPAKYFATRSFRGKTALYIFLLIPAVTPGICIIFGLMDVLIRLGIYRTYIATVLGQVAFTTPYFIFIMVPVFKRFETALEEQSSILGVGKFSTLVNVTLPAVKTGLATSLMLTFVISWSMYLVTSICVPPGFSTMAMTLLPLLGTGYATDSFVAITAVLFMIPALISLLFSTGMMGSDRVHSRRARRR